MTSRSTLNRNVAFVLETVDQQWSMGDVLIPYFKTRSMCVGLKTTERMIKHPNSPHQESTNVITNPKKVFFTLSWTLSSWSQGRDEKNRKTLQEGGQKHRQKFGFFQPAHMTNVERWSQIEDKLKRYHVPMETKCQRFTQEPGMGCKQRTFSSSSVKSSPLEDLLMAWATPMISPSLLRMGMHRRDLVLYPVSLSISSLKRRSCRSAATTQRRLEPSRGRKSCSHMGTHITPVGLEGGNTELIY